MRRTIRRRILVFAGCSALVVMAVVVGAVCVLNVALPVMRLGERNEQSVERVHCDERGGERRCDISDLKNDWEIDGADFLLVKSTRFFISGNPQYRGLWLSFSDPVFLGRFHEAGPWETPTGEVWRLYSERRNVGGKKVDIMVGQREKADWQLFDCPVPSGGDGKLKEEVERIAARVFIGGDGVTTRQINSRADGWQVVDADTGRVVRWNGEVPTVFPSGRVLLPQRHISLYREGADLLVVRGDESGDLLAVSVAEVGDLRWLVLAVVVAGAGAFLLAYVVGVEWLRKYFALRGGRPTPLAEALRKGEGQAVEFKHGLTEEAVLKSVTAFANTNDGSIFMGIDDKGQVRGLDLPTAKARDEFRHRLFSLIRDRVQPCPAVELDFEEMDEAVVARLFVRRGEAPLHYFRGVSYVRHGESSVTPRPEQVTRILAQFAF